MLRRIAIVAGLLMGLVVALLGFSMIASERGGEIVTLRTTDAAGTVHETRIWVVDADGHAWLRAGDPNSGWLSRLRERAVVEVERAGQSASFTAVPQPDERDRINALFRAKYGWADRYIGALFGRDDATPIRLDPSS
jgi:hypothetical protein